MNMQVKTFCNVGVCKNITTWNMTYQARTGWKEEKQPKTI